MFTYGLLHATLFPLCCGGGRLSYPFSICFSLLSPLLAALVYACPASPSLSTLCFVSSHSSLWLSTSLLSFLVPPRLSFSRVHNISVVPLLPSLLYYTLHTSFVYLHFLSFPIVRSLQSISPSSFPFSPNYFLSSFLRTMFQQCSARRLTVTLLNKTIF